MIQLQHPDLDIRSLAIRDLQLSRHPDRLELLKQRLERESNVELRFELRRSINEIIALESGERRRRRVLDQQQGSALRVALIGMDKDMQRRACHYCALHHRVEFLPLLLKMENSASNSFVRMCIAHMIRFAPERYFHLLETYLDDSDPTVSATAADTLASLGGSDAIHMLLIRAHRGIQACMEALSSMPVRHVQAGLSNLLAQTQDPFLVDAACQLARSLGWKDGPTSISLELPLQNLLKGSIKQSFETLKRLTAAHERAQGVLVILDREETPEVLRENLLPMLEDEDIRVRANTLESLAVIWPQNDLDWFLHWLQDESNRICGNAITALGRSPEFEAVYLKPVQERLNGLMLESELHALTGIYCIGFLQSDGLMDTLEAALNHNFASVQERARQILANWSLVSDEASRRFSRWLRTEKVNFSSQKPFEESGPGLGSAFSPRGRGHSDPFCNL